mmetsp:Transcript_103555/g.297575  ORF Transcript_103555/g.297575 Transcript_103555/m.297575 type:complete len:159 (+) Transcript_103555:293-769(+)
MNSPAGLRETEDPYRFLAVQGTIELLQAGPSKLIAVIPQIVIPMKAALSTRDPIVVCSVLKTIQFMLNVNPRVGLALAPYYRQILPQLRMFKNAGNRGVDDSIEYDQQQRLNGAPVASSILNAASAPQTQSLTHFLLTVLRRTIPHRFTGYTIGPHVS